MTKLYELERSGRLDGTYYQIGRKRLYIGSPHLIRPRA